MSSGKVLRVGGQDFDLRLGFFLCPKHGLFVPSRIDAEWTTDQGCPIVPWPGDDETCGMKERDDGGGTP